MKSCEKSYEKKKNANSRKTSQLMTKIVKLLGINKLLKRRKKLLKRLRNGLKRNNKRSTDSNKETSSC